MPVSHLGLTVSHIPSATSFYLSTLRPLGYRYVGQDGPTIGLGVGDQADLFLTQEPLGRRPPQPTHVAFHADSRLIVRDCYTAALNAGGYPSGSPGYCNAEGTVFNAAFEDLDGNTIEVIYKDHVDFVPPEVPKPVEDATETHHFLGWQQGVARSGTHEGPRPLSRARTLYDTASIVNRSKRGSSVPPQRIGRARTEPVDRSSGLPKKAIFGTLIGAAATAMFAYKMNKSERENADVEEDLDRSRRSKPSRRHSDAGHWQKTSSSERSRDIPTTHRYYQIDEPSRDSQPRLRRTQRTIEPTTTYRDVEVEEAITRRRRRSKPREPDGGRESSRSTRSSRRNEDDRSRPVERKHYHIEGVPPTARMVESSRRSAHQDKSDNEAARRDSGVSVTSHRSHRSHRSRHSQYQPQGPTREPESEVSTVRPAKRSHPPPSAAGVPLPPSRATSVSRSAPKPVTPEYVPVDEPAPRPAEDGSDGLDDFKTVVPDDSISCIDLPRRRKTTASYRSPTSNVAGSRDRRSRRQEEDRSRHSAITMPARSKPRPREQAYYLVRSDDEYQDDQERRRRSAATYR